MRVFGTSVMSDRKRLQLSQAALGRMVGVTQQAVAKWESGVVPESATLVKLIEALGRSSETARLAATAGLTARNVNGPVATPTTNNDKGPMQPVSPHDLEALRTLAQAASDIARAAQTIADSVSRIIDRPRIEAQDPPKISKH